MLSIHISERTAFVYSLIAFVVAALSITGVILKSDLEGRVIWTVIWGAVGVAWLFGIVRSRKKQFRPEE